MALDIAVMAHDATIELPTDTLLIDFGLILAGLTNAFLYYTMSDILS